MSVVLITILPIYFSCFLLGWYIPLFTAQHDPSFLLWTELVGEKNCEKLAETFKKPLCWGHYCELVSADNCTSPDETASRAPETDHEFWLFFVEGEYTGHFMATELNNCTATKECKGIWSTFLVDGAVMCSPLCITWTSHWRATSIGTRQ